MNQFVGGGHVSCDERVQTLDGRNVASPGMPKSVLPTHGRQNTESVPYPARATKAPILGYKFQMRAVLTTTDPVVLNYAANVLSQEGIESAVFDTHARVMVGSMGFLPRRLMVLDEDFARAEALLREAVPDALP